MLNSLDLPPAANPVESLIVSTTRSEELARSAVEKKPEEFFALYAASGIETFSGTPNTGMTVKK